MDRSVMMLRSITYVTHKTNQLCNKLNNTMTRSTSRRTSFDLHSMFPAHSYDLATFLKRFHFPFQLCMCDDLFAMVILIYFFLFASSCTWIARLGEFMCARLLVRLYAHCSVYGLCFGLWDCQASLSKGNTGLCAILYRSNTFYFHTISLIGAL